jgi:hypothetical protein
MLTDMGAVTRTIKTLIEKEVALQGTTVTTTAAPPDRPSANNLVSVYLYHVIETPESRNFEPARGTGPVPVQQAPLHLALQYIITVLHDSGTDNLDSDTLTEQKLIGFVARALHDFPAITKNTTSGGVIVMDQDLALQNAIIELILRPATKEESVTFWSAEQTRVARLSLFVEARVFVLEPKPPAFLPGIVLSVGEFIFPGSGPQLSGSHNAVAFRVPPSVGSTLQIVTASPARVALFPVDDPPVLPTLGGVELQALDNDLVTLEGVGLTPGRPTLILQRSDFVVRIPLQPNPPLSQNDTWDFEVRSTSVAFRVRRQARGFSGTDTSLSDVLLVPGIYTARVNLDDDRFQGHPRGSNDTAFAVTPQIASVAPEIPATPGNYILSIVADYLEDDAVQIDLGIGGNSLVERAAADASLLDGKFEVVDGSTVRFRLPTGATPPSADRPLTVRFVVNGATATPAWLTAEAT